MKQFLGQVEISGKQQFTYGNYYPFGLIIKELSYTAPSLINNGTENKFLFGGKELQDDLGLMLYDYHARQYDPVLGRFPSIDPMIESYCEQSPYNYVDNNPIVFNDPTGMFKTKFGAWWYKLWNGGDGIEVANDKGGEYYVYTDKADVKKGGVTSTRVFNREESTSERETDKDDDGWIQPHGVRWTLSFGQNLETRRSKSWESGGSLDDLISLILGGANMGQNVSFKYQNFLTPRRIDQLSDGFQAGNNANPTDKDDKQTNNETMGETENTLKKRMKVSSKSIPYRLPFDSITIELQDGNAIVRPRYIKNNGDTAIDRDPKSKRRIIRK